MELVAKYARLTIAAAESLLLMPVHARPDWVMIYATQQQISHLVARIKEIKGA